MNVERINLLDLQKEELTPQEKEEIYGKKIEKQNIGPDEADKIEEGFLAKNEVENNKKSKEIKMTQKKNEERGIEFFKKEIARLKKEIEKINNKKEKDPGNENLESRSTELEEILKKAEEELTEIRYGDSEIEKIANKEAEEVTSITIPDDKERRRRLELKLESYKEGGDDSRAIILGLVLEEGRIDIKTIMGKVKEAVGDKFNHFEFVSDYRIIKDYCETGGENVSGGGLPEVPVEGEREENIKELGEVLEKLEQMFDDKSEIENANDIENLRGIISEKMRKIEDFCNDEALCYKMFGSEKLAIIMTLTTLGSFLDSKNYNLIENAKQSQNKATTPAIKSYLSVLIDKCEETEQLKNESIENQLGDIPNAEDFKRKSIIKQEYLEQKEEARALLSKKMEENSIVSFKMYTEDGEKDCRMEIKQVIKREDGEYNTYLLEFDFENEKMLPRMWSGSKMDTYKDLILMTYAVEYGQGELPLIKDVKIEVTEVAEEEAAEVSKTEGEVSAVEVEEEPVVEPVEGEGEPEPVTPTEPAEPTETEAGRSWEEIGERAGGAEEVIKGMEAKVFEKIEGVEENPDIPKHEKEKAVFSLGIKEGKLDTVRITTEMAQLKAEEFKLKEGIKGIELKLKEGGLDEVKEGELQEELKGLEIERHRIIRETTRLAIEKRNGLESLKLSIEAAVADQNLKISKWEKGAGEKKEGFVSRLAGGIKQYFSKEAAVVETPTPTEEESEKKKGIFTRIKGMFSREKGRVGVGRLPECMNIYALPGHKVVITQEMVDIMAEEEKEKIENLEIGKVYTVEKTEAGNWQRDLYLKEFPNERFNSVSFSDVEKQDPGLDRQHPDYPEESPSEAEGGEEEGGETPAETPLPSPPVNEIPGGGTGEGSEEGAGEREQLGNEKKGEIKRILNGLEPKEVEILKQAFGNAIDAGYADWKVAALFRDGSDINDIIIKDNSEALEEVTVNQLMGVIQEYTEGEGSGDGEDLGEGENEGELGDEKKEEIKGKDETGLKELFKGAAKSINEGIIKEQAELDAKIKTALKNGEEDTTEELKKGYYNKFEEPWTEDFSSADFRKNAEVKNNLRNIFREKFNREELMDIWKIIENESEEDEVEKVITDKTTFEKATKGEVEFDEIKKLKVRELKYIIGTKINEKTGEIDEKEKRETSEEVMKKIETKIIKLSEEDYEKFSKLRGRVKNALEVWKEKNDILKNFYNKTAFEGHFSNYIGNVYEDIKDMNSAYLIEKLDDMVNEIPHSWDKERESFKKNVKDYIKDLKPSEVKFLLEKAKKEEFKSEFTPFENFSEELIAENGGDKFIGLKKYYKEAEEVKGYIGDIIEIATEVLKDKK